jgi:transposase
MSIAIQSTLFPTNPADLISAGHEARLVATVTHNIIKDDMIKAQLPGRPVVGNKLMCGLVCWAYLNKIYSSRKIEDKILTDASYIYLANGRDINFRTICVFRTQHFDLIEQSLKSVIFCALELNIRQLGEELFPLPSRAKKEYLRKRKNAETAKDIATHILKKSLAGDDTHKRIKNVYSFDSSVLSEAIISAGNLFEI